MLAELAAQLFDVDQERFATISLGRMTALDPMFAVERRAAARDQRVDVWMVVQPLVSRVEHELRSRLELSGAPQHFVERSPSGVEQQIVKCSAVTQDQAGQEIGQRKDDLKVVDLRQH